MTLSMAVAERIEQLLTEHDMTQYRLSMRSGVAQSSISDMRAAKNQTPNLFLIYELSQGFGITLADFFDSPTFRDDSITD
ncbi:MAG: helix-turn-helix domain-containing protein [Clostridia bacterium]|nr:helix-turn-helix domain-containing protein [Clostridia bacterium]